VLRVLSQLRAQPPDLLQSQHFFANAYVGLASRLLGLGGIGAIRNEGTAEILKNGALGGWLNLRLPRWIAANSRVAIQQTVARGIPPSRFYFLPNVVDTQHFKPACHPVDRPLTLLAVGRIVREKRLDRFISALGKLRMELELDVRGWIAGPTQDAQVRQELEAQAHQLGLLPAHLCFLGSVSSMAGVYQGADICVLTSDYEGTPNAMLEAMASGLPIVATNVGGVRDIVWPGATGFLVDREDGDGLVKSLAALVKNCARRKEMGRRARKFVETNHSLERLPGYLANLYNLALPPQHRWKLDAIEGSSANRPW
jgi:glycosyltransferase involved in cell wall biosynthesis